VGFEYKGILLLFPYLFVAGSRQASEDEEEEDDGDYSPEEDDWKKVTSHKIACKCL